jgi:hypothetical protein
MLLYFLVRTCSTSKFRCVRDCSIMAIIPRHLYESLAEPWMEWITINKSACFTSAGRTL